MKSGCSKVASCWLLSPYHSVSAIYLLAPLIVPAHKPVIPVSLLFLHQNVSVEVPSRAGLTRRAGSSTGKSLVSYPWDSLTRSVGQKWISCLPGIPVTSRFSFIQAASLTCSYPSVCPSIRPSVHPSIHPPCYGPHHDPNHPCRLSAS